MDYKLILESILENLNEGVLVVDKSANLTFLNEPSANIAGIEMEKVIGRNILDIFPDLTEQTSTFYHVLRTGQPMIEYVQSYQNNQGKEVTTVTSTLPLFDNGELIGAMEIYRGVDQVKKLSDKIVALQNEINCLYRKQKDYKDNGTQYTIEDLIGDSAAMAAIKERIYKVADNKASVLVIGETGTGKEIVVQSIHNASLNRRSKPFVAQNCAAIPSALLESIVFGTANGSFTGAKEMPGLFEQANGGTLFLDEINSMDLDLQAKLLRVLQDGIVRRLGSTKTIKVDVRVIAACNVSPLKAIEAGLLREDLYYRLNTLEMDVPPLRHRKDDIPALVSAFIKASCRQVHAEAVKISKPALDVLVRYSWPGNVRQLKSVVESMVHFTESGLLDLQDLPVFLHHGRIDQIRAEGRREAAVPEWTQKFRLCGMNPLDDQELLNENALSLKERVEHFERRLISAELMSAQGNISQAARSLGVPVQTLHSKMRKYKV